MPVPRRFDRRPPERDTTRINERIRVPEVRLIDDEGNQIGVLKTADALVFAQERDLDLVEVAPEARPPVCRVLDYSKYKYEQAQKLKQARKHQQQITIREIKFRPKIAEHDYDTKKHHVERFLRHKDKVKVTIMFRGREVTHPERGTAILDRLAEELSELGVVEQRPMQEGRNMTMMMAPSKAVLAGLVPAADGANHGDHVHDGPHVGDVAAHRRRRRPQIRQQRWRRAPPPNRSSRRRQSQPRSRPPSPPRSLRTARTRLRASPCHNQRLAIMPKMKTHSGAKKRFKVTATGKVRGRHAFTSHILEKKSPKTQARAGQAGDHAPTHDVPRVKRHAGGGQVTRVKRSVHARKKRRATLELTKGFRGEAHSNYKRAKEALLKADAYAYRDRRNRKRDFRRLWITRINAAARINGMSYSQFMHGLSLAGVELDRKVLADIAVRDADTFRRFAEVAREASAA